MGGNLVLTGRAKDTIVLSCGKNVRCPLQGGGERGQRRGQSVMPGRMCVWADRGGVARCRGRGDAGQRRGRAAVPGVNMTVWCDQIGNRTIRCDWIGLSRMNQGVLTFSALNKCAPTPPSSLVRRLSRSPSRVRLLARR